jgi:DNA polymerase-3 subunit gamma/tau
MAHLRSLLVSQDSETLKLLEVPPSIQEKYHLQAQQTSPNFLLDALQIVNQCAVQYKDSLNKRFHVELMLIELARNNGSTARSTTSRSTDASSPKGGMPNLPENSPTTPNTNQTTSTKTERVEPKDVKEKGITVQVTSTVNSVPNTPSNTSKKESLQTTIRVPQLSEIKASISQVKTTEVTNLPFTSDTSIEIIQEDVLKIWKIYAQQLKVANKIPAYNLLNQAIELEGHTILVKFTNPIEEHILADIKEELVNYLRNNLKSAAINIKTVFTPGQEKSHKPYTAQERFRHLVKKNPHLQTLKDELQLEIMD